MSDAHCGSAPASALRLPGQGIGVNMKSLLSDPSVRPENSPPSPQDARKHTRPRKNIGDTSSSSSEDDRRRRKVNVKEMVLDPLPAPHEFRSWVQTMYVKVCSASKRSKVRTLRWIKEVETAEEIAPLEVCSDKWDDLDTALAEAILKAAHSTLKRQLLVYQEAQTRRGLPLAGRAALWMCFDRFRLDRGQALCVDVTTLTELKFNGDLEGFLTAWDLR